MKLLEIKQLPPAMPRTYKGDHIWIVQGTLEGAPEIVIGSFYAGGVKLTTLKHGPSVVVGDFSIADNKLQSLEHAPKRVGANFSCAKNKLQTLDHCPEYIGGAFLCYDNKLKSLQGIHKIIKHIGGTAFFNDNPIKSHILGLLLIDGLKKVELDIKVCQHIINKHLGKGKRGMFDAQQELIEAGFLEMAKL